MQIQKSYEYKKIKQNIKYEKSEGETSDRRKKNTQLNKTEREFNHCHEDVCT